jgi:hypothetical protein
MSKLLSDVRKAFVGVLSKHDKVYHFDDDPRDIYDNDNSELFEGDEARVIAKVVDALYDDELFTLALNEVNRRDFDHIIREKYDSVVVNFLSKLNLTDEQKEMIINEIKYWE